MFLDEKNKFVGEPGLRPLEVKAPELDEIGQCLMRAADVIRVGGLAKGALERGGSHCALGAIKRAAGDDPHGTLSDLTLKAAQPLLKVIGGLNIAVWNNADERTAEEVIAALEAAAQATNGSGS